LLRRSGKHREEGVVAELLLIVRLAGRRIALPAREIERWSSWRG
jgi:hypothetical protein